MNSKVNKQSSVLELHTDTSLEFVVDQVTAVLTDSDLSFGHGAESAEAEAVWLVLHACQAAALEDVQWERSLKPAERRTVELCLSKRLHGKKPMAYILQQAWFAGLSFYVDERVLVPRSFLAEWIPDQFVPWIDPKRVHSVLDLCCGCGCIGIATALAFEDAKVVLSDISPEALEVASINIDRYDLGNRVSTHCGNRFAGLNQKFDLILCNPPYVSNQRMAKLPAEYVAEPEIGLRAGVDGLDFIRPFLAEAREFLTDKGYVVVEAGSASGAVELAWPDVTFTWLGTEHDEMVLFLLSVDELDQYNSSFQNSRTASY